MKLAVRVFRGHGPLLLCMAGLLALAGCATAPGGSRGSADAGPPPLPEVPAAAVAPLPPVPADYRASALALDAALRKALQKSEAARSDGYTYGTDVAQLLLYAARRGDAALYGQLMPAAQALIQQRPEDPYTGGFVLARGKPGAPPEASSAGAALWMARALWAGAAAFGRAADRAQALTILDGYARHAYVMHEVWLARHGFGFARRGFEGLSLVSDYAPDFLAEAERAAPQAPWRGFTARSYALLDRAATPSGLLLPLIQPEVGATWPGAGLETYAPDGLASLEQACLGAEGAAAGRPQLAGRLLDFVVRLERKAPLRAFYRVEDGAVAGEALLPEAGYACLARLAAARGRDDALARLDPDIASAMRARAKARDGLATAGSLLLAAQARGAF